MRRPLRTAAWAMLLSAPLAACTGTLDSGPSNNTFSPEAVPARVPLRPLTPAEVDFSLEDMLGDDTSAVLRLQPSRVRSGVETLASTDFEWAGARSDLLVDAMYDVAVRAVEQHAPLAACRARTDDARCMSQELRSVARLAWRRPPTDDEMARIDTVVATLTPELGRSEAMARGLQAILLSPDFLYLTSIGGPRDGQLASLELASRLSYFLWASLPDEALLAAAERDELSDPAQLELHARRMLRDPRAGRAVSRFVSGWLGASDLGSLTKSDPAWDGPLVQDIAGETDAFVVDWFRGGDRAFGSLFYTDHTFVTPRLADLYGITLPEGAPVDRPTRVTGTGAVHRYGLLTQASFLASHSLDSASSPTIRGHWFIERALCQGIDPPPATALRDAPAFTDDMTTREWHEAILANPGCATCHSRIAPPGFAFERFDAIGRVRTHDRGEAVITTATLETATELDGAYESEEDLSEAVASSPTVRACFARNWIQYATGRPILAVDRRLVAQVARDLETDAHEALVHIVTSPTFRTAVAH